MIDNNEEAELDFPEFFGEDLPWRTGGSGEKMERISNMIDDIEKFGIDVKVNIDTRDVVFEPSFPNTWKDVAKEAFDSQQSSGLISFGDTVEDRCEMMETWKECAMDVLGYTEFD